MQHLLTLYNNGLASRPRTVVEIGPGDSLGIGIAALLSGVERYIAVDAVKLTDLADNLPVLGELVALFARASADSRRQRIPPMNADLAGYDFPAYLIDAGVIRPTLNDNKLQEIRNALLMQDDDNACTKYFPPRRTLAKWPNSPIWSFPMPLWSISTI